MGRPLFGPDRKHLGHPATTRFLDRLDEEERREEARRLASKRIVDAEIQAMLDRQDAQKASA